MTSSLQPGAEGFDPGASVYEQSRPSYPPEADLVGNSNQIDDADLAAFLARFGGRP